MSDDDGANDSIDDSVSIESNPFARSPLTQEKLDYYRKLHEENPHPAFRGPPLESSSPEPLAESSRAPQRRPRPGSNPKEPKQHRAKRLLAGLEQPQPGHGLSRSPDGRIRSLRLQAAQSQSKKDAAPQRPARRPASKPARPKQQATTTTPVAKSAKSKTGRVQKRAGGRRRGKRQ